DRDPLDVLSALAGRDAGDDVRPVRPVAESVEATIAPGQALHDEPRVAADDDRHLVPDALDHECRQLHPAVGAAIAEQLADPGGVGADTVDAREPRLDLKRPNEDALDGDPQR